MRTLIVLGGLPIALVSLASLHAQEVHTGANAFGTRENDKPGISRHIRPTDLPRPTLTQNDPEAPDFENKARVVKAPAGKMPDVPPGFTVQIFASGLNQPASLKR